MVSDQCSSRPQSSGANPSMSAIITRGSGAAMSATRSQAPDSHTRSMISSHTAAMRGPRARTAWGVNPSLTSRRRRRCSGASMSIMCGSGVFGRDPPVLEKRCGSWPMARTSS